MRLPIFFLFLARAFAGILTGTSLTYEPKTVRATSTYIITFETASSVSTDYSVNLVFPEGFTLVPGANYPCTLVVDFGTPSSYHCEATATELKAFGAFSSILTPHSVNVKIEFQVANPLTSTQTNPIGISIVNAVGGTVDSDSTNTSMRVTAIPEKMAGASISPQNQILGHLSTSDITITPSFDILAGTAVVVVFP